MAEYSAARTVLQQEQERLLDQMARLGATSSGNLRRDLYSAEGFSDAAAATAERTELLGIVSSLKKHLDQVEAALARIEDETYGICAHCGIGIAPERMEARPASRLCVQCQSART